jgi:hypothetical protein
MNRNLAVFLLSIAIISIFALVIMTSVPRKGVVGASMPDAVIGNSAEFTIAKTDPGFLRTA